MKNNLLRIAEAFDADDVETAENLITEIWSPTKAEAALRRVLLGYWRRLLALRAVDGTLPTLDQKKLEPFFAELEGALTQDRFWALHSHFDLVEGILGAGRLSNIVNNILWDRLADAPYGFQYDLLTRSFIGGDNDRFQQLFAHILREAPTFVPDFWQFQSLIRSWSETGGRDAKAAVQSLIERTDRGDLRALVDVYLDFALQTDAEKAFARAARLTDKLQKERVCNYLLGASQTPKNMALAVELFDKLSEPESDKAEREFMRARLGVVNGKWAEVKKITTTLIRHPRVKHEALCLHALATAHAGDTENAKAAVDHIRFGGHAPWFLNARAALVNVSIKLIEEQKPLPNDVKSPALAVKAGRPVAQSLWVGPKLRWIEEMSMQSYLANGWRYQLYTYESVENVPAGVEVLDAGAVLGRSHIFREGAGSGMHKGSLGAFSDLFRYALLSKRGGMWTDTDVINLRRFEPEGKRFISTELSDAGLIGLNGAMMAAPAGDHLQADALIRATRLLDEGGSHFARVGPELLAELIGDGGTQGYTLLPTDFLNPVGWMETGTLLRPFAEIKQLARFKSAFNIHVYTETWRLLGLSLTAPPSGEGFLAVLYDRLMNMDMNNPQSVRTLMRR